MTVPSGLWEPTRVAGYCGSGGAMFNRERDMRIGIIKAGVLATMSIALLSGVSARAQDEGDGMRHHMMHRMMRHEMHREMHREMMRQERRHEMHRHMMHRRMHEGY